jgi:hypothetical protein
MLIKVLIFGIVSTLEKSAISCKVLKAFQGAHLE